jgi:hypothetical protein
MRRGSVDDKDVQIYLEEQRIIKQEIERKQGKTTEQLYIEKEKRARDATELKEPDRVPLSLNADPASYTGRSCSLSCFYVHNFNNRLGSFQGN